MTGNKEGSSLSHPENPAGFDAAHFEHNATGRVSMLLSRVYSLLCLSTTTQVRQVMPGLGVVQATGLGVEDGVEADEEILAGEGAL